MASFQRNQHLVDAPILTFDINDRIAKLKQESQWLAEDRNAITLLKNDVACVVLIILKAGATLGKHEIEGQCTLQVISGLIHIEAENVEYELKASSLTSFEPKLKHVVEAREESVVLLTILYNRSSSNT